MSISTFQNKVTLLDDKGIVEPDITFQKLPPDIKEIEMFRYIEWNMRRSLSSITMAFPDRGTKFTGIRNYVDHKTSKDGFGISIADYQPDYSTVLIIRKEIIGKGKIKKEECSDITLSNVIESVNEILEKEEDEERYSFYFCSSDIMLSKVCLKDKIFFVFFNGYY
jgi:hypothetical protein